MSPEIRAIVDQVAEKQIRDSAVNATFLTNLVTSLCTPEGKDFFSQETQASISSLPSAHHDNSLSVLVSQIHKGKESYTGYIRGGVTPEGNMLIDTIVINPAKAYTIAAAVDVLKKTFAPAEKDHIVIVTDSAKVTLQQIPQIAERLGRELSLMEETDGTLSQLVEAIVPVVPVVQESLTKVRQEQHVGDVVGRVWKWGIDRIHPQRRMQEAHNPS